MTRSTIAAAAIVALAPVTALTAPTATAADGASPRAAAPTYKVTATINRTEVVAGETVKIRGHVTPAAAGEKVLLQQRRGNQRRWRLSGTATVRRTGAFVLKDDPSVGGHRSYRVVKPAGDGVAKGVSKELELAVWAYESLTSRPAGASSGVLIDATTYVATDAYPDSIVLTSPGGSGFVEYTLGDECRLLEATHALTDDSPTGASGTAVVNADGVPVVGHTVTTGSVDHYEVGVQDVFRIRVELKASTSPAGRVAVASPRVLCLDE